MTNLSKKTTKIEFLRDFIIKNISEGGILIETSYLLPINSIHFLNLTYKEMNFYIKGIVKRVEKSTENNKEFFRIAFQFIDINSQQKSDLKNFINLIKNLIKKE